MALIKCTECGNSFSGEAPFCPNCACPTEIILKNIAETERKNTVYASALKLLNDGMKNDDISAIEKATKQFESIITWKDSMAKLDQCDKAIAAVKVRVEEKRIVQEKAVIIQNQITFIATFVVCIVLAFFAIVIIIYGIGAVISWLVIILIGVMLIVRLKNAN